MTFHCWDVDNNDWKTLKGDKDGDMYYEADQDMAVGQWNELWLKLDNNNREWTGTTVRSFSMHASNNASFIIDGVYTCSRDWKTFYYSCDYLNSPRVMTDATGAVVWRQDYLAFGGDYNTTATGNTHKFTGHVKDDATGQYYAKARYFTTGLGRWSQPEPLLQGVPAKRFLLNPQKLNPYLYCLNNPLLYSDPTGFENTIYILKLIDVNNRTMDFAKESIKAAFKEIKLPKSIKEVKNINDIPKLDKTDAKLLIMNTKQETNDIYKAGLTANPNRSGQSLHGSQEGHVYLDNLPKQEDNKKAGQMLGNVSTHELGHGFGLVDNANNSTTDVMKTPQSQYIIENRQQYFNRDDATTLQTMQNVP